MAYKRKEFDRSPRKCVWCGKEFIPKRENHMVCCTKCRAAYDIDRYRQIRYKKLLEGVEGIDYIIDLWTGNPTTRICGKYIEVMHPGRTIEEYKAEFPDAPIRCSKDREAVTKYGGRHMKTEKYKKMFSEKFKGENNPNHKTKTTYEQRCTRSPFSKKFYEVRGLTEEDRKAFTKRVAENRSIPWSIEFYMNKGYDRETARKILNQKYSRNTLECYTRIYGKELGPIKWKERNRKWSLLIEEKYRNGEFSKRPKTIGAISSEAEIDFINKLLEVAKLSKENCFYTNNATNTDQLCLKDSLSGKQYSYDFCYKNKIIEFNGDFWHMNPAIYESTNINRINEFTAEEIWLKDENKRKCAEDHGYSVLYVWESDWTADPDYTLKECIKFLNED